MTGITFSEAAAVLSVARAEVTRRTEEEEEGAPRAADAMTVGDERPDTLPISKTKERNGENTLTISFSCPK